MCVDPLFLPRETQTRHGKKNENGNSAATRQSFISHLTLSLLSHTPTNVRPSGDPPADRRDSPPMHDARAWVHGRPCGSGGGEERERQRKGFRASSDPDPFLSSVATRAGKTTQALTPLPSIHHSPPSTPPTYSSPSSSPRPARWETGPKARSPRRAHSTRALSRF